MTRRDTTTAETTHAAATPADLDYRMPAEWEPHAATWLSWPHNRETWPSELEEVEAVMTAAVRALAPRETVRINVLGARHERHVRTLLDDAGVRGDVRLHHVPTDDAWIRDHGAVFVTGPRGLAATAWGFNSWGGKYPPWDLDDAVPPQMAALLDVPVFDGGMVLEGGSIDVNGAGLLLTTETCLLNPNRNPDLERGEIEQRLRAFFCVERVLWLGDGIAGDDTDGHVDDITRFVAPDAVVTAVEPDPGRPNHAPLAENLERLRGMTTTDGRPLRILELPMPAPVVVRGEVMPATYANFYVANGVVLMPAYRDPQDEPARRVLERCFPGREVVPLDCRALIWGLGAFHCLTQQVPRLPDPNGHTTG